MQYSLLLLFEYCLYGYVTCPLITGTIIRMNLDLPILNMRELRVWPELFITV